MSWSKTARKSSRAAWSSFNRRVAAASWQMSLHRSSRSLAKRGGWKNHGSGNGKKSQSNNRPASEFGIDRLLAPIITAAYPLIKDSLPNPRVHRGAKYLLSGSPRLLATARSHRSHRVPLIQLYAVAEALSQFVATLRSNAVTP